MKMVSTTTRLVAERDNALKKKPLLNEQRLLRQDIFYLEWTVVFVAILVVIHKVIPSLSEETSILLVVA